MRIFYPGCAPAGVMPNGKPWPELRLDQLEAIYRIKHEVTKGSKSVLVGAGMGSGKTVVSIEVILKTKPDRCLIVGVKDAYGQWAEALKDQQSPTGLGVKRKLYRIDGGVEGMDNLARLLDGDPGLFYIGLEMLRAQDWHKVSETVTTHPDVKDWFSGAIPDELENVQTKQKHTYKNMAPVDLLISDESHKHSNQKSASIQTVRSIPALAKVALSGTFFGNKFENAWSLCTWLWGKAVIGTKGAFERDFCVKLPVKKRDGKPVRTPSGYPVSKIMGERNPGDFVETLPCYVFIATPIGPVPKPEVVKVKLGPEQARQYGEMERQSLTWIPSTRSKKREPLIADLPIVQRIRLRTAALGGMTLIPGADEDDPDGITFSRNCKSTTLDVAHAVLHRPNWVGKKALILTHSKPFAEEVARRIGQKYSVALKTGDVSSKQWEADKAAFMQPVSETGSIQYLVAVISAAGTATDGLQAHCAKVLWLSEDENNVNNIQGSNRVWRDGVDLAEYEAVKIVQQGTIAEGVLAKNNAHRTSTMTSVAGAR